MLTKRYLTSVIESLCFSDHKMAFVSGPRQCGKTTLAKMMLEQRPSGRYANWDDIELRRLWAKNPKELVPSTSDGVPLLVLDEIHKARTWKRSLKGIYDTLDQPVDILVTGSARLSVYRKGSDSLLGRYFPFRLHPLSLHEIDQETSTAPGELLEQLFGRSNTFAAGQEERLESLMRFGPFPEPLLAQHEAKARLWRRTRHEAIIREDLRDLSRIPDLSRVEMLASLLPERVGAPRSLTSLREDLEVSHNTIKRWLQSLEELYFAYTIRPYQKRIARSLKKEGKLYLWDWSEVTAAGARFENLVAGHLLKACHFWTDTGCGLFELYYLRTKDKIEIDFLITRDSVPWLPVEVKLSNTTPTRAWRKFLPALNCRRALQVVQKNGCWQSHHTEYGEVLVASAAEVLDYFP